ncbi:MAG: phytoene/squalene synthase family protein [Saprospiraceae bacterium]|nr:phytoene/squalene synthase family protein [Saprospiraceae bacterium]
MMALYDQVCNQLSRVVTLRYSTSFSLGIRMIERSIRPHIFAIYGFVRLADEIVDTFHDYDKEALLHQFRSDTYQAIEDGISLNPILHAFQKTVNTFGIERKLIDQFLHSMEMDLHPQDYERELFETYILGSAEVVGLMCLKVFCRGDQAGYERLKPGAMRLGAAFQKVNFLRDIKADKEELGRIYFPNWTSGQLNDELKAAIEQEIAEDFRMARESISKLPGEVKIGVYSAYVYYKALFLKIRSCKPHTLFQKRVRISNPHKMALLFLALMNIKLNRV